jgi:CRP-like cAMP-binding protein
VSWLFKALPREERARIDSVLASCATLSLRAGSALEAARLEAASLLAVEEGLVSLSAADGGGRRMVVAFAGARSLALPPAGHERLEALADSELTLVTASAYQALLGVPETAAAIADGLSVRLRDCQESLRQFSNPRHVGRVRQKLIQLARTHGKAGSSGVWLSLPLTHEVLAEMVGSTRETVTRAMSQLAREGFVRHERGAYRLAVPPEAFRS